MDCLQFHDNKTALETFYQVGFGFVWNFFSCLIYTLPLIKSSIEMHNRMRRLNWDWVQCIAAFSCWLSKNDRHSYQIKANVSCFVVQVKEKGKTQTLIIATSNHFTIDFHLPENVPEIEMCLTWNHNAFSQSRRLLS